MGELSKTPRGTTNTLYTTYNLKQNTKIDVYSNNGGTKKKSYQEKQK